MEKVKYTSQKHNYFSILGVVFRIYRINSIHLLINRAYNYTYSLIFKRNKRFKFNGKEYHYFYHWYNVTFRNERCVEVAIGLDMLNNAVKEKQNILELGNVLSHYTKINHLIIDKYEKSEIVVNEDIMKYSTSEKYDLIVSISTLEHVGWNEEYIDKTKFLKAIDKLDSLLSEKGKMFITMGLGWNEGVDEYAKKGNFGNYKVSFMEMYSPDDYQWKQVEYNDIQDTQYDEANSRARAIIIIEK